jgi:archaeal flagellar protein FlaD
MSEVKKEGGEPDAADFDLQLELSSLVADQIIPQSIAEKLEKKLVEKQVDITKDQLHALADKIHDLIQTYKEKGSLPEEKQADEIDKSTDSKNIKEESEKIDTDLKISDEMDSEAIEEYVDKIQELQQKIDDLKQDKPTGKNQKDNFNDFELPYNESISTSHLTADPLQSIPSNPESIIVLMNWLQYLVNRCGHENLADVLDYYVEVDWITDDVKISLLEYSTGITEGNDSKADSSAKKSEEKNSNLPSKDHIQSYMYIQRLKGRKIEKHFVERINGEIARIQKKIDTYHHTQ